MSSIINLLLFVIAVVAAMYAFFTYSENVKLNVEKCALVEHYKTQSDKLYNVIGNKLKMDDILVETLDFNSKALLENMDARAERGVQDTVTPLPSTAPEFIVHEKDVAQEILHEPSGYDEMVIM